MNHPKEFTIHSVDGSSIRVDKQPAKIGLSYNVVSMASELLLLFDLLCLLVAALLSNFLYSSWLAPLSVAPDFWMHMEQATLVAAVLAPFILYDRRFGAAASRGHIWELTRSHALRFTLYVGVVFAIGTFCQVLERVPSLWITFWFVSGFLFTSLARLLATHVVRNLQRRGVLTEVIAVVGAGPLADRLVQSLRETRAESVDFLGVFDDKVLGAAPSMIKSCGTLSQLLELGKTRKIDWILLTLPPTAEQRVLSIVQRLKALSVPIGLCPQHMGPAAPRDIVDHVANGVPVSLLADRPMTRWYTVHKSFEDFLPRWLITLTFLPLAAIEAITHATVRFVLVTLRQRAAKLTFEFDNYDLEGFTKVAAGYGQDRFGYVVTPNADHMIRLHEDASFRALYAAAAYILLDSRFLAHVLRFIKGLRLPVCTGSDLTEKLLSNVVAPDDPLVLIGGSNEQAQKLRERYGLRGLAHFNPPMGFIRDPRAVDDCLRFVEAHSPFRFCLLAVGAPQQEAVAERLKARGVARGLALCVGASINFLTGDERRAPLWMQRYGIEWLYRLLQAPGRMAKRYLVRGPRVFGLLHNAGIVLRSASAPMPPRLVSVRAIPVRSPAVYVSDPYLAGWVTTHDPSVSADARSCELVPPNQFGRDNQPVRASV